MSASGARLVQGKLRTAYRIVSTDGPTALLREAVARVLTVETYLAYHVDLRRPLPETGCDLALEIRCATEADFQRFRRSPRPLGRHAEFRDRYGIDRCYLARAAGDLAHVAWIYYPHERRRHPTRFRRLRDDEVALANCLTLPDFRGRGVYAATLRTLLQKVKDEGYRHCYMYVEVENMASRRGVAKAGFRLVGRSWRIRSFLHRDPAAGIYLPGPPWRRP